MAQVEGYWETMRNTTTMLDTSSKMAPQVGVINEQTTKAASRLPLMCFMRYAFYNPLTMQML